MKFPVIVLATLSLLTVPAATADDVLNCGAVIWTSPELQSQWDTTCGDVNTVSNLPTLSPVWVVYNSAVDTATTWADWSVDTAMIPVSFAFCMAFSGPPCVFEDPEEPPLDPEDLFA